MGSNLASLRPALHVRHHASYQLRNHCSQARFSDVARLGYEGTKTLI